MAKGHLSHDEFFTRLGELFESRKGQSHGAIYLTQKRLSHGQDTPMASGESPVPDTQLENPLPVLIRASNGMSKPHRGEKLRLSTVVDPDTLDAFYARYAELCKASMTALKPRDRSKKKSKARKKKGGAGATGPAA